MKIISSSFFSVLILAAGLGFNFHPCFLYAAEEAKDSAFAQEIANFEVAKKQWEAEVETKKAVLANEEANLKKEQEVFGKDVQDFQKNKESWMDEQDKEVQRQVDRLFAEKQQVLEKETHRLEALKAEMTKMKAPVQGDSKESEKIALAQAEAKASSQEIDKLKKDFENERRQWDSRKDDWQKKIKELSDQAAKKDEEISKLEQIRAASDKALADSREKSQSAPPSGEPGASEEALKIKETKALLVQERNELNNDKLRFLQAKKAFEEEQAKGKASATVESTNRGESASEKPETSGTGAGEDEWKRRKEALDRAIQDFEAKKQTAELSLQAKMKELDAQSAELDKKTAEFRNEAAATGKMKQELEAERTALEKERQDIAQEKADIEKGRRDLALERQGMEKSRENSKALADEEMKAAQEKAALDRAAKDFEAEKQTTGVSLQAKMNEVDARSAELNKKTAELRNEAVTTDKMKQELEAERTALESERQKSAREKTDIEKERQDLNGERKSVEQILENAKLIAKDQFNAAQEIAILKKAKNELKESKDKLKVILEQSRSKWMADKKALQKELKIQKDEFEAQLSEAGQNKEKVPPQGSSPAPVPGSSAGPGGVLPQKGASLEQERQALVRERQEFEKQKKDWEAQKAKDLKGPGKAVPVPSGGKNEAASGKTEKDFEAKTAVIKKLVQEKIEDLRREKESLMKEREAFEKERAAAKAVSPSEVVPQGPSNDSSQKSL